MSTIKTHFPGLNGVRAIAALIVIFFHVNHNMGLFGLKPIKYFVDREEMSRIAVVLFLVLSGFLITYLLLLEKKTYDFIELKKFYIRRILRIWPLYYMIIIIALIIFFGGYHEKSTPETLKTVGYYSIFLSNFALINGFGLLTIAPLWSVGVEEQFYVFWPVLIGRSKKVLRSLIIFWILYECFKEFFSKGIKNELIYEGFDVFAFDTLAVGGIMAYLYFTNHKILKLLYQPSVQIICWGFFMLSLVIGKIKITGFLDKDIYAVVFAVIILNVSSNSKPIISLENKFFNFLGRISYGIYLFHMTIVYFISLVLRNLVVPLKNNVLQFIFLYVLITVITVVTAHFSYKYFESWFLKLKKGYTKISSSS